MLKRLLLVTGIFCLILSFDQPASAQGLGTTCDGGCGMLGWCWGSNSWCNSETNGVHPTCSCIISGVGNWVCSCI